MEQTSQTPAFTAADLAALRHQVQQALITQAQMLLKRLQQMELPKTPQEVGRHASALLAVSRAFNRIVPAVDSEDEDDKAAADVTPVFRNRQQRRKAEAKSRKGITRPLQPGNGSA